MARLSEAERRELRRLARSVQLRDDLRLLRRYQDAEVLTPDQYLQFLNALHALCDHVPKKFTEIKGNFFLL
ncbi:hypothetical protein GF339_21370 [candidate division KSB3 bacterium]|uniref:Uncharacterized protein n=1 Tax=candidate division KSB3 bacterium TaxID=2044937 RepID=A0A9D5Q8S6_9BACT|nr:hypothetical protein [candidate division KSB3 bacterium]MBD3327151.1 hypothetical protein [candidate division KSB3 bacterium]